MIPVLNQLDVHCAVFGNHDFGKWSSSQWKFKTTHYGSYYEFILLFMTTLSNAMNILDLKSGINRTADANRPFCFKI